MNFSISGSARTLTWYSSVLSSRAFFYGLGGATLIAMYDYGGYNNVCFFAGEVRQPEKVIPRSIIWSVVAVRRWWAARQSV